VAILVGRREGIKGGERDFSRSRVNHGLLSSPTVYAILEIGAGFRLDYYKIITILEEVRRL
jgi:hypothetical protein